MAGLTWDESFDWIFGPPPLSCQPLQTTAVKLLAIKRGRTERVGTCYSSCNWYRFHLSDAVRIGPIGHTTTGVTRKSGYRRKSGFWVKSSSGKSSYRATTLSHVAPAISRPRADQIRGLPRIQGPMASSAPKTTQAGLPESCTAICSTSQLSMPSSAQIGKSPGGHRQR